MLWPAESLCHNPLSMLLINWCVEQITTNWLTVGIGTLLGGWVSDEAAIRAPWAEYQMGAFKTTWDQYHQLHVFGLYQIFKLNNEVWHIQILKWGRDSKGYTVLFFFSFDLWSDTAAILHYEITETTCLICISTLDLHMIHLPMTDEVVAILLAFFFFLKCKWRAEALEAIVWLINHCSICHLQMPSRWSGAAKIKLLTNMQVVLWMWPRWQRLCCCRAPLLFCCLWVRRDGRCTVVKCKRIVWQVCTCMCGGERGREEIVAFLRWEIRIISSLFDEI